MPAMPREPNVAAVGVLTDIIRVTVMIVGTGEGRGTALESVGDKMGIMIAGLEHSLCCSDRRDNLTLFVRVENQPQQFCETVSYLNGKRGVHR